MVEEFYDAVGGLVVTKYSNGHFSVCIDRLMGYKVGMSYMFTVHFQAKPLEVALILCFICRFVSQSVGPKKCLCNYNKKRTNIIS